MRAMRPMMNRSASTARPAMTQALENPNITSSLPLEWNCWLLAQFLKTWPGWSPHLRAVLRAHEFLPRLHIGDPFFVTTDYDFRAFFDGRAVVAARAETTAHALLFEDDFAGAAVPDGNADRTDRAFMAVIPFVHVGLRVLQEPGHEPEDQPPREHPREHRDRQTRSRNEARMRGEDVAGSSEPGEESEHRGGVEPGQVQASLRSAQRCTVMPDRPDRMKGQVRLERQREVQGACEKRDHAERKAH